MLQNLALITLHPKLLPLDLARPVLMLLPPLPRLLLGPGREERRVEVSYGRVALRGEGG